MRLQILGESSNQTSPQEIKGNKQVGKKIFYMPNKVKIKKHENYYKNVTKNVKKTKKMLLNVT